MSQHYAVTLLETFINTSGRSSTQRDHAYAALVQLARENTRLIRANRRLEKFRASVLEASKECSDTSPIGRNDHEATTRHVISYGESKTRSMR